MRLNELGLLQRLPNDSIINCAKRVGHFLCVLRKSMSGDLVTEK